MYTDYWFDRTFDAGLHTPPELHYVKTAIGSDVWVGAGANIVGGVTIGDGCVIGAGAVITRDVEPYSIVVGVPGRVMKKRFSDDVIECLEKIRWWDWPESIIRENVDLLRKDMSNEILSEMKQISARCVK